VGSLAVKAWQSFFDFIFVALVQALVVIGAFLEREVLPIFLLLATAWTWLLMARRLIVHVLKPPL